MTGHGEKFSRKKDQLITALLSCRTLEEAAQASGVSIATAKRWQKRDEFKVQYLAVRRESMQQATARLQHYASSAVNVVLKLMADPNTPASVRLRASACVIEQAHKTLLTEDLELRVSQLEKGREEEEE